MRGNRWITFVRGNPIPNTPAKIVIIKPIQNMWLLISLLGLTGSRRAGEIAGSHLEIGSDSNTLKLVVFHIGTGSMPIWVASRTPGAGNRALATRCLLTFPLFQHSTANDAGDQTKQTFQVSKTWKVYITSAIKSYSIACVIRTRANSPGGSSR